MKQLIMVLLAITVAACADAQTPKQAAPVTATLTHATIAHHIATKDPNRSNRCEAITKKGQRCKRDAKPRSHCCAQHQGYRPRN